MSQWPMYSHLGLYPNGNQNNSICFVRLVSAPWCLSVKHVSLPGCTIVSMERPRPTTDVHTRIAQERNAGNRQGALDLYFGEALKDPELSNAGFHSLSYRVGAIDEGDQHLAQHEPMLPIMGGALKPGEENHETTENKKPRDVVIFDSATGIRTIRPATKISGAPLNPQE